MHRERGQVLPLWVFGVLASLALLAFVANYANVVRWQVRAQNAADAAAQALLALQAQQFNQMGIMLYASAVEEFRVRRLLHGMLLAAHQQGGCGDPTTCASVFAALRTEYLKSVQRYTNDVIVTNRVTANLSFDTTKADATALLAQLTSTDACSAGTGGDCAFSYKIVDFSQRTDGLQTVKMDALGILIPSFSNHTASAALNQSLFAPARIEVAVCAQVQPLIGGFFGFAPQSYDVIGRAAATTVMVEQDWMQPGQILNPINGGPFQPAEQYVAAASGGAYDWYAVDFGGNTTQAYEDFNVYSAPITSDEFSERVGWWNSIPIPPYSGQQDPGGLGCPA